MAVLKNIKRPRGKKNSKLVKRTAHRALARTITVHTARAHGRMHPVNRPGQRVDSEILEEHFLAAAFRIVFARFTTEHALGMHDAPRTVDPRMRDVSIRPRCWP